MDVRYVKYAKYAMDVWTFPLNHGKSKITEITVRTSKSDNLLKEEEIMKSNIHRVWMYLMAAILALTLPLGCGSDEPGGGGSAGTTATGGMGGAGGNGGEAGTSAGGTAGTPVDVWQNGKTGSANKVSTIMEGGGPIVGFDILRNTQPMMRTRDWDPDSGLPPTIPDVDFSQATPNSTLVMVVPPYLEQQTLLPAWPPYTVYIQPDGTIDAVEHFSDWTNTLAKQCYSTFPVTLNGIPLQGYGGMVWDVVSGLGRDFVLTSANDCVYQVLPNGTMETLACDLGGPASLFMHPMKFLVISTLPGFVKNLPNSLPERAVKLYKLIIDSKELTEITTLPIPADYEIDQSLCYEFPYTSYALPTTLNNPLAILSDGSLIAVDSGANRIYNVDIDTGSVQEYAQVDGYINGLTVAPNDVMYGVFPPMLGDKLDGKGQIKVKGPVLKAYDKSNETWVEVTELPGYTTFAGDLGWANTAIPCPQWMLDLEYKECLVPVGLFMKLVPGETPTNPYIMISDPVTMRLFQVVLEYGQELDAGLPEAGDDADSGTAGTSGSAGSAGTNGTSGSAGSAGASGTSGSAGSAPQSAPYPPAQAPAHEFMAEDPEDTPLWVWFALLGALGTATLAGLGLRRR